MTARTHRTLTVAAAALFVAGAVAAAQKDAPQDPGLWADPAATTWLNALPATVPPAMIEQQHRNLDTAMRLLAKNDEAHKSDLHRSVALAKQGTKWQAATLGLSWVEPVPLSGHKLPSQGLLELADRYGVPSDPEAFAPVSALDGAPEPLRGALARFVDAFLAFDAAVREAYAHARPATLALLDDPERHAGVEPGVALQEAGVHLAGVFPTRNQLLDAVLELNQALEAHGVPVVEECAPVQVPPAFSIDLTACDNHYTTDFALLLDAGGDDRYHNNAGGNNLSGPTCPFVRAAAALVSLGDGDDEYGDPDAPRGCGVNGGAVIGAGFLLSAGGNDRYSAGATGTNGGATNAGVGFLLDAAGDDVYEAEHWGTNGAGGRQGGVGFLLDAGGNDTFRATHSGANGGGGRLGSVGFLMSAGGDDSFEATEVGTNGGGALGRGFLLNAGGDNTYRATHTGVNGGGSGGVGFLWDQAGDDTYIAERIAANGGGSGGLGLLLDAGGNDRYLDDTVDCKDCSAVPKGLLGAQIDVPGPG